MDEQRRHIIHVAHLIQRYVPESVRWLIVQGKTDKARAILEKVAATNKKEMPSEELHIPITTANKGVLELFKTWKMAKLSLIQIYAWCVKYKVYSLKAKKLWHKYKTCDSIAFFFLFFFFVVLVLFIPCYRYYNTTL